MKTRFRSFSDFYPFYLSQHAHPTCRRLHFLGAVLSVLTFSVSVAFGWYPLLLLVPVIGYGFAWIGHFHFEHNKPATFQWPFYSLMGDFVMARDIIARRIPF